MNIYIITAGEACKIGVAKDVDNRLAALRTGSPSPLEVQHTMRCKNSRVAYKIESISHKILAHKRLEGEWFKCTPMEAVIALNEAVLEFAARDCGYVDMPRGGEMALSSRAMRYVKLMRAKYGLKAADVVDEAIVEYFGPAVDGAKRRHRTLRAGAGSTTNSRDLDRDRIESSIRSAGREGITRGRLRDRLGISDTRQFGEIIDDLIVAKKVQEDTSAERIGRPKNRLVYAESRLPAPPVFN